MRIKPPEFRKARIEIIPMIDTIFFLLVYYIFVTMQMVHMSALTVGIPKPSPPVSVLPPKCHVDVDAAGNFLVDGRIVGRDGVTSAVAADISRNADTTVIISVAPSLTVQPLIDCLDAINQVSKPDGSPVNSIINGQGGVTLPD
jgi:biopolymer transport protein ExbD